MVLNVSPGQLYSTASGHLFYAGKICIIMVGLPGRGKTQRSEAITRYLRWLGVKAQVFHLGEFRRAIAGSKFEVTPSYFDGSDPKLSVLRTRVTDACFGAMVDFYSQGGQVAVYDAINGSISERESLRARLKAYGIESLFVESLVTDERILARNIGDVRTYSPDYINRDPKEGLLHYLKNMEARVAKYESVIEPNLLSIKLVNDGERCIVNNGPLGYLLNRVLLFLLNVRPRRGSIFFARAGSTGVPDETYRDDSDLSEKGMIYARTLANTIIGYVSAKQLESAQNSVVDLQGVRRYADPSSRYFGSATASATTSLCGTPTEEAPLIVWTSARRKSIETGQPFKDAGVPVSNRSLLNLLNPGNLERSENLDELARNPAEWEAYQKDPYHHRFPRGESYQDVAIRLEPLMMELERIESNLVVIAHESVLRVLYGYTMNLSVEEIPKLKFPANQVVEVVPNGYRNTVVRIPLAGVSLDGAAEPFKLSRIGSAASLASGGFY